MMNPYMQFPLLSRRVDGDRGRGIPTPVDPLDDLVSIYAYRSFDVVGNLVGRVLDSLRTWQRRRRAINELTALDNRSLKDIGLQRSQIRSVVEELLNAESSSPGRTGRPVDSIFATARPNAGPEAANDNRSRTAA